MAGEGGGTRFVHKHSPLTETNPSVHERMSFRHSNDIEEVKDGHAPQRIRPAMTKGTAAPNPNVRIRKTGMRRMQVERRINGSLSSKLYGFEKVLSPLVAKACISVCPKNKGNFNVDNVRVVKIPGGGVGDAQLVHGVVIKREPEGTIRSAKKAKVAVFVQGVDTASTETKVVSYTTALCAESTLGQGSESQLGISQWHESHP